MRCPHGCMAARLYVDRAGSRGTLVVVRSCGCGAPTNSASLGLRTLELGNFTGSPNMRLMLNKKPVFAAGWLDQSWWPDGQSVKPFYIAFRPNLSKN